MIPKLNPRLTTMIAGKKEKAGLPKPDNNPTDGDIRSGSPARKPRVFKSPILQSGSV